jgi:2-dehydropantoate 2-reductase
MSAPLRILVAGAGATGGYFGALLALAGRDVTFLVRPRRAAQLRETGLRVRSPRGDFEIEPALVLSETIESPYDVVLVAVKAYDLDEMMTSFAAAVGEATVILPFLNGMRHLDVLAGRFGAGRVLGGACVVMSKLDADGSIVQLADQQSLTYGERDGSVTPRVRALDAALHGAGFEATLSETIVQDMWHKWTALATLGGITCLMRGTIGEIEAVDGGADLARALYEECCAVAAAAGYAPLPAFRERALALVTQKGAPTTSSMYRDLAAGNRTEGDQILGDMAGRARASGLHTPLLAAASANLAVYQNRLAASR